MALKLHDLGLSRPDISTVRPHEKVVGTSRVGVEVELEGIPMAPHLKYWEAKADGSLRNNGVEFVFSQPLGGIDIYRAIEEFHSAMAKLGPSMTWRTSTHVHLDVRDMSVPEFRRLLLAYVGYEDVLFQLSGAHRAHSIFCPSTQAAQQQIVWLSHILNCPEEAVLHQQYGEKYSGMNIRSALERGSVEFRGSEAKWQMTNLLALVNRILTLKRLAQDFAEQDYKTMIDFIINTPVQDVFGESVTSINQPFMFNKSLAFASMMDVLTLATATPQKISKPRRATVRMDQATPGDVVMVGGQREVQGFGEWLNVPPQVPENQTDQLIVERPRPIRGQRIDFTATTAMEALRAQQEALMRTVGQPEDLGAWIDEL